MIPVHEEPPAIQREFGSTKELCEFCHMPTRFWDETKKHTVCEQCAPKHSIDELRKEP